MSMNATRLRGVARGLPLHRCSFQPGVDMHRIGLKMGSVSLAAALLWMGVAPVAVSAQALGSASLTGRVLDESGAPVPDVAVSVTSPALQVASASAVTDQ